MNVCRIEGCTKEVAVKLRSLCRSHYHSWALENKPKAGHQLCTEDDCDQNVYARGWCQLHYNRWRKTGSAQLAVRTDKLCTVNGCEHSAKCKGLCNGHYQRLWQTGSVGGPVVSRSERLPSYNKAHRAVYKARGKAEDQSCVECGLPAQHWALLDSADVMVDSWSADAGKMFSMNPDDYAPMCVSDHFAYDRKHGLRNDLL